MQNRVIKLSIFLGGFFLLVGYSSNNFFMKTIENNVLGINTEISKYQNELKPAFSDGLEGDYTDNVIYKNCIFYNNNTDIKNSRDINYLTLVGKEFKLEEDVVIDDLVDLRDYHIKSMGSYKFRKEATENLALMVKALDKYKINYTISSAFRTNNWQSILFNNKIAQIGRKDAITQVAQPGSSEHEIGSAIDIITSENDYSLEPTYHSTKLSIWLEKNASEYGFTQSFQKDKQKITGIVYEPWHYRYVGKKIAKQLKEETLSIFEYLLNKYNYCLVEDIKVQ